MIRQSFSKVGVYVDVANIYKNGGSEMQYDVLRDFACRDGSEPVRLNAYAPYDMERAKTDTTYKFRVERFHSALRERGFKVILKEVKKYQNEFGELVQKANADLDLAVDALLQSENLDRVLLVSGDGDFVQVVRALQNKGCRVEVVAVNNVASALKQEADMFISGYLIPNLIPNGYNQSQGWGQEGSWVRGTCYYYDAARGIGYFRYLTRVDRGLWMVDKRKNPDSPYESAFFHISDMKNSELANQLPHREIVFEFQLERSERKPDQMKAVEINLVNFG